METEFLLTSSAFSPTQGELDEDHDDFINPNIFAIELANFLEESLTKNGYPTKFRCQEDWGHWLEVEHDDKFTLAVCCANTEACSDAQTEHRVFLSPDKPIIRRFFKKIDVQSDLEKLSATLRGIFENSPLIDNVTIEGGS